MDNDVSPTVNDRRPTKAFLGAVETDDRLMILSAVSLLLPVVVLCDVLLDIADALSPNSGSRVIP